MATVTPTPRLMLMVPDWIDEAMFTTAVERVAAKDRPVRVDSVRLEVLSEGRCVQTLHVGSFDDEGEVLSRMHDEFIAGQGLRSVGRHHEIYLSDFRRATPEKQRTILRQPVATSPRSG
jgi:hypothetical protein